MCWLGTPQFYAWAYYRKVLQVWYPGGALAMIAAASTAVFRSRRFRPRIDRAGRGGRACCGRTPRKCAVPVSAG